MDAPPAAMFSKLRPLRPRVDGDPLHAFDSSFAAISGQ